MAQGTDIVFVAGYTSDTYGYRLLEANSTEAEQRILSANKQNSIIKSMSENIERVTDNIRLPYDVLTFTRTTLGKSYIWWMDDPWAALVALSAIIILLCIIAMVVIVFSYSRYIKFKHQFRIYQSSYGHPDFIDPQDFMREYETQEYEIQSLAMNIPADESVNEYGEVGLRFDDDELQDVEHPKPGHGTVMAVVNPVYVSDEPQARQKPQYQLGDNPYDQPYHGGATML